MLEVQESTDQQIDTGQTTVDVDNVDVQTISDDDLEKMLFDTPESGQLPDSDETEPQSDQPAKEEGKEEKKTDQDPDPETKTDTSSTEEEMETISKGELGKLRKQVEDKEHFIQKQSVEIGNRRQQEKVLESRLEEQNKAIEDNWIDKPLEASKAMTSAQETERKLADLKNEGIVDQNKEIILQSMPDIKDMFGDIATLALQDGIPQSKVNKFKANPYGEDPVSILNYARRVKMNSQISELTKEVGKLKGKPEAVVKNIEKALSKTPEITEGTGHSKPDNAISSFSESQIPNLTDAQLKQYLAED